MTTARARAAEEEYFRKEEAERRRDETRELQRTARTTPAGRQQVETRPPLQLSCADMSFDARRDARRSLNRLIVAGWGESLALAEAAFVVVSRDAQRDLQRKAERRQIFRGDLSAAVVALGGKAAKRPSRSAQVLAWTRSLRRLLNGAHEGDAYAACSRATERTCDVYSRVLSLTLPEDMQFGIERQQTEVKSDLLELRRLRWGARAMASPGASR